MLDERHDRMRALAQTLASLTEDEYRVRLDAMQRTGELTAEDRRLVAANIIAVRLEPMINEVAAELGLITKPKRRRAKRTGPPKPRRPRPSGPIPAID